MKFFTITVVSLSLGCQVLAAPMDISSVAGVATWVESAPSEAVASAESLAPVGDVAPAVTSRAIDITTITGAVSGLKSSISPDLSTIKSMSASNATAFAIPVIKSHLRNMATQINATVIGMAPALVGVALPLSASEAEALLSALAEVESLVFNIKSTLSATVSTIKSDAVVLIAPEIATVLGLVLPLVSPLTTFIYGLAALAPGGDATLAELSSKAASIMGVAGTLKGPVGGLLGGVL